jgi:hypothetical protein
MPVLDYHTDMRIKLLLFAAIVQVVIAALTTATLVPRIRLVEAVTIFATAFGAGATFVGGVLDFKKARRS